MSRFENSFIVVAVKPWDGMDSLKTTRTPDKWPLHQGEGDCRTGKSVSESERWGRIILEIKWLKNEAVANGAKCVARSHTGTMKTVCQPFTLLWTNVCRELQKEACSLAHAVRVKATLVKEAQRWEDAEGPTVRKQRDELRDRIGPQPVGWYCLVSSLPPLS